jgi:hypothetical protein
VGRRGQDPRDAAYLAIDIVLDGLLAEIRQCACAAGGAAVDAQRY